MSELDQKPGLFGAVRAGFTRNLKQYAMIIALLGIWAIFTYLTQGIFISPRNISNLMVQNSYIAILAVGMVLVIVAGHIDLSVGSVAGFCGAVAAYVQCFWHWGTLPAILAALGVGLLVGIWQGYWIAFKGVPAFIVTLAGWGMFRGMVILVTGGQTIAPLHDSFTAIGVGYIPQLFLIGKVGNLEGQVPFHDLTLMIALAAVVIFIMLELRNRSRRKGYGFEVLSIPMQAAKIVFLSAMILVFFYFMVMYRGIPWAIVVVAILVLLFNFISTKTVFGRRVYAIGGNKEAARLSGINIKALNMAIFVAMGVLSAISGIVFTARLNSATASAGNLFELDAIAAAIIGGTSTLGGEGTIIGAIIGALVMGSLNNGMQLLNIQTQYQMIIKGLILLLAVWFDISSRKTAK
jgi:D-xylose transport system permease protein